MKSRYSTQPVLVYFQNITTYYSLSSGTRCPGNHEFVHESPKGMGEKEKECQALEERRCKESKDNQKIEKTRGKIIYGLDLAISNILRSRCN